MTDQSTKQAILDAAQQLFSRQGFASTSLRAIIKEAGVNTAAIHYHFGSREGLIEAVIERHAGPVNRRRLEALDRLEAEHTSGPLPVEGVVRAFLEPVRGLIAETEAGATLPRMMGHAIMETDGAMRPIVGRVFKDVVARFAPAFGRALPGVPAEDVMWRVHFMLGAMVFTLNVPRAHRHEDGVEFEFVSIEDSFEKLVDFVTAGMQAPPPAREERT